MDQELAKISEILSKNLDKPMVKRIVDKDIYPVLENEDGTVSTHSMSWGDAEGKYYVYPTVVQKGDKLERLDSDKAFQRAIKDRDYIEFDSPDEADWFSKNYKRFWDQ